MSKSAVRFQQRINRLETRLAPNNNFYKKQASAFAASGAKTIKKKRPKRERRRPLLQRRDPRFKRINSIIAQYRILKTAVPVKQAKIAALILRTWKNLEGCETADLCAEYTEKLELCRTHMRIVSQRFGQAPKAESSKLITDEAGSNMASPAPLVIGQLQQPEYEISDSRHSENALPQPHSSSTASDDERKDGRTLSSAVGEPPFEKPQAKQGPQQSRPEPEPDTLAVEDSLWRIRKLCLGAEPFNRKELIAKLAESHGQRPGCVNICSALDRHTRIAVRRGVLKNKGGKLLLLTRSINDYDRNFLKREFLCAIGRDWVKRDEGIRRFARHLGFKRVKRRIHEIATSVIRGLSQQMELQIEGKYIRKFSTSIKSPPISEPKRSPKTASRKARPKKSARPKPPMSDEYDLIRTLQEIRNLFSDGEPRARGEAIEEVARRLIIPLTINKNSRIDSNIRAAVRNGILERRGKNLSLVAPTIDGYNPDFLKQELLRVIGREKLSRKEAIRRLTRHLGFRRTGSRIESLGEELIGNLMRNKELFADGEQIERL